MRVTRIDFEGEHGVSATIERKICSDFIFVKIMTPNDEKIHYVDAGDLNDQYSMAECLQQTLDGHEGSNSMVHDYYREIQQLGDC